jgi:hypothetical protein
MMYFFLYCISITTTFALGLSLLFVLFLINKKIRANELVTNKLKRYLYLTFCALVTGIYSLHVGYEHLYDETKCTTGGTIMALLISMLSAYVMMKSAVWLFPRDVAVGVDKEALISRVEEGIINDEDDDDIFIF